MRSLLRASTVTDLRIFFFADSHCWDGRKHQGWYCRNEQVHILYIHAGLLPPPLAFPRLSGEHASAGDKREAREGDDGNERRARAFSPLLITPFVPSRFPVKINPKYPPKIDRERLRTRLQIFFLIFFKKRRCLHAQVHKSSAGVFFGRAKSFSSLKADFHWRVFGYSR